MADKFTIEIDTRELLAALDAIPAAVLAHLRVASKITADNIAREAKSRVARRTGETAEGIHVEESYDGSGYVVLMGDAVGSAETARRKALGLSTAKSKLYQGKHTGIWLEFGTKFMTKREFFFPSARLEEAAHDRRSRQAIQDAIDSKGLGE